MNSLTEFVENKAVDGPINTLIGILLETNVLSIQELEALAKLIGIEGESKFFSVYMLKSIEAVTAEKAGVFINKFDFFNQKFREMLSTYGKVFSTNSRGKLYYILNFSDGKEPRISKESHVISVQIAAKAEALLQQILDTECPCMLVCSTIRHGINSIYWSAEEIKGQTQTILEKANQPTQSFAAVCDSENRVLQSYISGYQFNKQLLNMALTLNFSMLNETIMCTITDYAHRDAPAFNTRITLCLAKIMSVINQVIDLIGEDILLIDTSNELLNSYLEVPQSQDFEEISQRIKRFLTLLEEKTRFFEECSGKTQHIVEYIKKKYTDPSLNIGALGDAFGISRAHLSRTFKTATGINISKYLESTRIEASKALLQAGLSITDTAAQCGYYDRRSFSAAFKRVVGATPGTWLKQQRV